MNATWKVTRALVIVAVAASGAIPSAAAAIIQGNLYDLETVAIERERVAIRVVDFRTNTLIPVNDISDPRNPRRGLTVVDRTDGRFAIEIPDDGVQFRVVSIRFRRPDRAEVDTQDLAKIVVESGKSYVVDTTVPELKKSCIIPSCGRRFRGCR